MVKSVRDRNHRELREFYANTTRLIMKFLELSSSSSLPQWTLDEGLEVRLSGSITRRANTPSRAYRSSPIHPLVQASPTPDLSSGVWYINFLVPQDAFTTLGRIAKRAYPGMEAHTWFGLGLASIIIFSHDSEEASPLVDDLSNELIAFEKWRVEEGKLANIQLVKIPTPIIDAEQFDLPKVSESSPSDLRGIVEEFSCSFQDLHRWAAVYAPAETYRLKILLDEVTTLVKDLLWLHTMAEDVPDGLTDYDLTNQLVCSKLIQQRTDRIVQINAALSYVVSQGFFGAPPILSDSCLVRRHSLLGIGRAHRALLNLVREIEEAFGSLSVPASIYMKWTQYPALAGFESSTSLDSATWASLNLPDVLLAGPADPHPFKLVYFSGRLGYRESEYAISAAIHALTSGDSPEWHLSTMTHEILHGHVRDLLYAIFDRVRADDIGNIDEFWTQIFLRFQAHMNGSCSDNKLIDSVRSVLLSYCCMTPYMGSLTHLPTKPSQHTRGLRLGQVVVPDSAPDLRRRLEEENRNISEIVVHTLDLYYFYSDNFEAYNRAIWASWRTVPVVLRDVRQYVLRMLLSRTALDHGEPIERFARARNQLRESLSRLNSDFGPDSVWESAIRWLELEVISGLDERTNEAHHALFQPFFAALRVVDLARHCFTSGRVKEGLFHEDVLKAFTDDSDFDFGYTPEEFSDRAVRSIAEFTSWRARTDDPTAERTKGAERRTAWLFLACGRIAATINVA